MKEKRLILFLLLSGGLYALWFILYEFWLKGDGHIDEYITVNISYFVCKFLNWTGYDVHFTRAYKLGETFIFNDPNIYPFLRIGASCNGLELLVLFSIFIVCYPGNKRYLIPYLVIGNILIHILNTFRNYWLALMSLHKSEYFDLFHRYIFIFMVYGFIFTLWMLWVNKFSEHKSKRSDDK